MAAEALGVLDDPALVAAGWVRRHLVDPDRAQETAAAYAAAGFEVHLQAMRTRDFGAACQSCAASACGACYIVYTRRPPREAP